MLTSIYQQIKRLKKALVSTVSCPVNQEENTPTSITKLGRKCVRPACYNGLTNSFA